MKLFQFSRSLCISLILLISFLLQPRPNVQAQTIEPPKRSGLPVSAELIDIGHVFQAAPVSFRGANNKLFIQACDAFSGCELWVAEADLEKYILLKDIYPGIGSSYPGKMMNVSGVLYFVANDGVHGWELWKSDGTSEGTVMVKDIIAGTESSNPSELYPFGGYVYFSATFPDWGTELWRSDGTETGTVLVKDINSGSSSSNPQNMFGTGGFVYFSAQESSSGRELWKTDGTEGNTILVADIAAGTASSTPSAFCVQIGYFYFGADDSVHGRELWRSNGATTTELFNDINPGSNGSDLKNLVCTRYSFVFSADDGSHGVEPWINVGSIAGNDPDDTKILKDINSGAASSNFQEGKFAGGKLYFQAETNTYGAEPWVSDLTPAGTVMLGDFNPGVDGSTANSFLYANTKVFFRMYTSDTGYEMWVTDGTAAGTQLIYDLWPGDSWYPPMEMMQFANKIVFENFDGQSTIPMATDGTIGSFQMIYPETDKDGSAYPDDFILVNNKLVFTALTESGQELWQSGGTEEKTSIVKDIWPGANSGSPTLLQKAGNKIFFVAKDGSSVESEQLWVTDGTTTGTTMVKDFSLGSDPGLIHGGSAGTTHFGGEVLFFNTNGENLWRSDGTESGTLLIKEFASINEIQEGHDAIYLNASLVDPYDMELYVSDGTDTGTVLLKDINSAGQSEPKDFFKGVTLTYFTADDGAHGRELWRTDGSESGTQMVIDMAPGSSTSEVKPLLVTGDRLYFMALDGNGERELWMTGGAEATTVRLSNLDQAGKEYWIGEVVCANSTCSSILFAAYDNTHGYEVWQSNNTLAGTHLVKDIYPGINNSDPGRFVLANGYVYFTASDPVYGREIWRSNGTEAGTFCVAEVYPGNTVLDLFSKLYVVNDNLLFRAYGDETGYELYRLKLSPNVYLPLLGR